MSDTQLLMIITGALLAVGIIGLMVLMVVRHNIAGAIQIAQATRTDIAVLDKIEAAATGVVPVSLVLQAIAMFAPLVPAGTSDEVKLRDAIVDILKQISDGQPNRLPTTPPASPLEAVIGNG